MITINNLSIQYGAKHLFKNISGRINIKDRIGLVGVNGAGKSTLLKILAGISEADPGVVTRSKQVTCGYLPQEIVGLELGRTLYDEAESAFSPLLAKQKELDEINSQLADADNKEARIDELLKRQGELQHELDHSNVFRIKATIEKVLLGLGFHESDLGRNCHTFSGGWLMRLMLAKQLLASPSFLFLDEPTNHLDIESLTWLEEFLSAYPGALIIVSHDRTFLDNMTTSTWELSLGNLTIYKGNYSTYVKEKELRLQIQRAAYTNQQARIDQTKRFVDRFRSKSTKAKQVQSRVKQLEKMEIIELEDTEQKISFRFPPAPASGRLAIAVTGLCKGFAGKDVFKKINFELQRGDKIAIVGVNGAGKSTLVKILAGLIPPDSGSIRLGHNISLSYFGQHQAQELSPLYTVLETVTHIEAEKTITQTRSLLGAFLFKGDDVDKKVQVLSGGEKSRLALAKMIATPANLLIMDEPTNHLDMMSQDILQDALAQYDGSIIIVSHNRYFLDHFVNKVLEIKNGRATLYDGNLAYYLEKTAKERQTAAIEPKSEPVPALQGESQTAARGKKARQEQAKIREGKNTLLRPFLLKIKEAEIEISRLESLKADLETKLADPELYKDQEAFTEKSKEYASVERRLSRLYQQWEENQEKMEKVENSLS
ncbi:MAG: ABC-F family ATP-binding cassette domain-containing protein [Deltaproteobacteria bacterium]|nr:ABC-F family ATP-binding cassette domain-containing protein [Deltaproteobacteria bacterium]